MFRIFFFISGSSLISLFELNLLSSSVKMLTSFSKVANVLDSPPNYPSFVAIFISPLQPHALILQFDTQG